MSRQSKQRNKAVLAKMVTAQHRDGSKGPSGTEPKHGKIKTWSRMGRKVIAEKKGSKESAGHQ